MNGPTAEQKHELRLLWKALDAPMPQPWPASEHKARKAIEYMRDALADGRTVRFYTPPTKQKRKRPTPRRKPQRADSPVVVTDAFGQTHEAAIEDFKKRRRPRQVSQSAGPQKGSKSAASLTAQERWMARVESRMSARPRTAEA